MIAMDDLSGSWLMAVASAAALMIMSWRLWKRQTSSTCEHFARAPTRPKFAPTAITSANTTTLSASFRSIRDPSSPVAPQGRRRGTALSVGDDSWAEELKRASGDFVDPTWRKATEEVAPEDRAKIDALLEWLQSNGAYIADASDWGQAPHPLALAGATTSEEDGEESGRGLLARREITEGRELMRLPMSILMTKQRAQQELGKSLIDDDMNEYFALAILLIAERAKGEASFWKPYIDLLPTTEEVGPAFTWSDEDIAVMQASPCRQASQGLKAKVRAEYEDVMAQKGGRYLDPDTYTFEAWEWAFTMLFSRAVRLASLRKGEALAFVPYADMINHSPYSRAFIDAEDAPGLKLPWQDWVEEVVLYADRGYGRFKQIFISYGQKSNAELMLLYGFALDRNPFNSVGLQLRLSPSDPLYDAKQRWLRERGQLPEATYPLYADRFPEDMLRFLRLACVTEEQLKAGVATPKVTATPLIGDLPDTVYSLDDVRNTVDALSADNEAMALESINEACRAFLESYETTDEDDGALISDRGMFAMLSRNARMAIRLRRSEKRLIKRTMAAVDARKVKAASGPRPKVDINEAPWEWIMNV